MKSKFTIEYLKSEIGNLLIKIRISDWNIEVMERWRRSVHVLRFERVRESLTIYKISILILKSIRG